MKSSSLRESLALLPGRKRVPLHFKPPSTTAASNITTTHTQDVQRTSSPRAHTHQLHALSPITALLITPPQLSFPAQGARCQCHFAFFAHTLRARLQDDESNSKSQIIKRDCDYKYHACAQQERVVTFSAIVKRRVQQTYNES